MITRNFLATDIDRKSLEYAAVNLSSNVDHDHRPLSDRVRLHLVQDKGDILAGAVSQFHEAKSTQPFDYDFCMCNPPFFDSLEEQQTLSHPEHCCAATTNEAVTPGGEAAFVGGMVNDSLKLRKRVCWYTSMVGRKVSVTLCVTATRE